MRRLLPVATFVTLLLGGCGPIDPEPPRDAEGEVIEVPGPFDTWLRVVEMTPDGGEVGPQPTIRLRFDTWIDEDELLDFSVVSVSSAGLSTRGRVKWTMTTRTLEFTPFSELVVGLKYDVNVDGSRLESVTGAPFQAGDLPKLNVVQDGDTFDLDAPPPVRWAQVDAILEARCRSCHADPEWGLNPLTRASLIGARSEQSDAILVLPFDPGDSYLMHKILPRYPVRRFTVQPPPWSGVEPLTESQMFTIERWISNGARN